MNTRPPIESSESAPVLCAAFNDDCSMFTIGRNNGFAIYRAGDSTVQTIREFSAGFGIVRLLRQSNFIALVGGGRQPRDANNKVCLWDESKGKVVLEISALMPVRGVQLSPERIIVVLQNSIRVYAMAKQPKLLASYETADNLPGLCALSARIMAFPGRTAGQVQLVELATGTVSIIPAHSSALRAMTISPDGELLATASDTGTLIRVFATGNCARLAELRRGIDAANIYTLGFSPSGLMLACTSDKSTLHIFDIPHPRRPPRQVSPASPKNAHREAQLGGCPRTSSSRGGESSSWSTVERIGSDNGKGKWGILGKLPLMPRVFSDVYSFASVPFEASEGEPVERSGDPIGTNTRLGTTRPAKGIIGWTSDETVVVIGTGKNARWEKFRIVEHEGRRHCVREGWKRVFLPDM